MSASGNTTISSSIAGRRVTPYAIPISIVGMVSSEISISLRLRGISHVLVVRMRQLDRRDRIRRRTDSLGWTPMCCCRAAPTRASPQA